MPSVEETSWQKMLETEGTSCGMKFLFGAKATFAYCRVNKLSKIHVVKDSSARKLA